jgi:cytochrome c553
MDERTVRWQCWRAMTRRDYGVTRKVAGGACAAALLLSSAAHAAPDIELGRYLARECMTCHRTAKATSTIPNIFGMAAPTMTQVVKAYRDKKLENAVMQGIAGRLKDDEIEALAAYFERTKKP